MDDERDELLETALRQHFAGLEPGEITVAGVQRRASALGRADRRRKLVAIPIVGAVLVGVVLVAASDQREQVDVAATTATTNEGAEGPASTATSTSVAALPRTVGELVQLLPGHVPEGMSIVGAARRDRRPPVEPVRSVFGNESIVLRDGAGHIAIVSVGYEGNLRYSTLGWSGAATRMDGSVTHEDEPDTNQATRVLPATAIGRATSRSLGIGELQDILDGLEPVAGGSPLQWRPTTLPDGWEIGPPLDGLVDGAAAYGFFMDGATSADGTTPRIEVLVQAAPRGVLDAMAAGVDRENPTVDVNGHPAYGYDPIVFPTSAIGMWALQWWQDGVLVMVNSTGTTSADQILDVARGLRVVSPAAWDTAMTGPLERGVSFSGLAAMFEAPADPPTERPILEGALPDGTPWTVDGSGSATSPMIYVQVTCPLGGAAESVDTTTESLLASVLHLEGDQALLVGWSRTSGPVTISGSGAPFTIESFTPVAEGVGYVFGVSLSGGRPDGVVEVSTSTGGPTAAVTIRLDA